MQRPSSNAISLPFGSTAPPYSADSPHKGVDFVPGDDPTVYAPCDARVILLPNNGRDGNGLYFHKGSQFHGLLHNDQYLVEDGAMVKQGQPVAIMGWTGYVVPASPAGTHSHWCVKENDVFIDPLSLVEGDTKDMIESSEDVDALFLAVLHGYPENDAVRQTYVGMKWRKAVDALRETPQFLDQNHKLLVVLPELEKQPDGTVLKPGKYVVN